jgi:hypothetical protein
MSERRLCAGHLRINRPKAFLVTLAGRGGSLNLFIFSATALAAAWENG